VFGDEGEDQVGRDRRHLVEPRLAVLALDVIFLGERVAAEGLDAGLGRVPGGFRRQQLGDVRLLADLAAGLDAPRGFLES
jgi:hypothetical protein